MTYAEKLKDPRWQKRRLEVLEAAGWECESCGDKTKTLHIHHLRYYRGFDPWDYTRCDLKCLCEECHERITAMDKDIAFQVSLLEEDQKEQLRGYMDGFSMAGEWADLHEEYPIHYKCPEWANGLADFFGVTQDDITEIAMRNEGKIKPSDIRKKKF